MRGGAKRRCDRGSHRDFQSNCCVNVQILVNPLNFTFLGSTLRTGLLLAGRLAGPVRAWGAVAFSLQK
jgi:hypothetical protein